MKLILAIIFLVVSCGGPQNSPPPIIIPIPPIPLDPCEKANAGPDRLIRRGEAVEIGGNNLIPGVSYLWFPRGEVISQTSPRTVVSPSQTTVYLLRVKTTCGVTFDTVKVKVL